MTFTGLDVEAAGTETFAYAGQQRVPMLYFNIKAENQLNPIQLREVAVTVPAGAESAAIEKVAVFQLGENKTPHCLAFTQKAHSPHQARHLQVNAVSPRETTGLPLPPISTPKPSMQWRHQ